MPVAAEGRSAEHALAATLVDGCLDPLLRQRLAAVADEDCRLAHGRLAAAQEAGREGLPGDVRGWARDRTARVEDALAAEVRGLATDRLARLLLSTHYAINRHRGAQWLAAFRDLATRWAVANAEHAAVSAPHRGRGGDVTGVSMPPGMASLAATARQGAASRAWDLCLGAQVTCPVLRDGMRSEGAAFHALGADVVHHVRHAYGREPDERLRQRMRGLVLGAVQSGTGACRRDDLDAIRESLAAERAAPGPR